MKKMTPLSHLLIQRASGFRSGIVPPFQKIPNTFADIEGYSNIAIPEDGISAWQTASGCMNRNEENAICGAIGESIERYGAAICDFPVKQYSQIERHNEMVIPHHEFALFADEQYANSKFPWKKPNIQTAFFGEAYSLYDNQKVWLPQELIGFGSKREEATIPSTSTGLAAHTNSYQALLSALQEVLERDALTVSWLNSLGGRDISLPKSMLDQVTKKGGMVQCFDITQDWNPHPVVLVCGSILQRNKKRISMGVACRHTYAAAIEKAFAEWLQGIIFTAFYDLYHPGLVLNSVLDVTSFDLHAIYYTLHPKEWEKVPLLKNCHSYIPQAQEDVFQLPQELLKNLLSQLKMAGLRIYYRDLTTPDAKDAGLSVVRVLSPEMSPIHGDENQPFLGGRVRDVKWRYTKSVLNPKYPFPNPFPHPLG